LAIGLESWNRPRWASLDRKNGGTVIGAVASEELSVGRDGAAARQAGRKGAWLASSEIQNVAPHTMRGLARGDHQPLPVRRNEDAAHDLEILDSNRLGLAGARRQQDQSRSGRRRRDGQDPLPVRGDVA